MTSSILILFLFFAPVTLETGHFNILQDGKKIGTEDFTIAARNKGYFVEGKTQFVGETVALVSRMELDEKLTPISYEFRKGTATLKIKVAGPQSEILTGDAGKESSSDFRFPDGGFIVDNNFFHHILLLLYRVNTPQANIPVFVPQDLQVGQAVIRSRGNRAYDLQMGDVKLEATTDANGRLLRLTVPSAKVVVER